jgi:predicted DNA-binding transcriptional regulator AlpA
MRAIDYTMILRPSVDSLKGCSSLMIDTAGMAAFLGVSSRKINQLACSDRIPIPCQIGRCIRWNVLELLEWVEAGCPRMGKWIEMRGSSGGYRRRW